MNSKKVKSIEDIAKIAGVSKSTVSRSLNDSPLISDKTKKRVKEIAQKHHFYINQAARSLNTKRSGIVALVMPIGREGELFSSDPFIQNLLGSLVLSLNANGYDLLIVEATESGEWIAKYGDSRRVDGFLMMPCADPRLHILQLQEREFPFVVIGKILDGVSYVSADDRRGGYLAVEHLISGGGRLPAFIGGPESGSEVRLRLKGYAEALRDCDIPYREDLVVFGDYSPQSGAKMMAELLRRQPQLDSVFVCSDLMARGVLEILDHHGRTIPDEVSLVGYDNTIASYTSPTLSTVHQDIDRLGREAVRLLLSQLDAPAAEHVVLPVKLIVRQSSRPV